jgi:hypothetical protein
MSLPEGAGALPGSRVPEGRSVWVEGGKTRVVQLPLVSDLG